MSQEETTEKPLNNGEMIDRNPNGTIKKGVILNPNGKPKGTKHFATLIGEMLKQTIKVKKDGQIVEVQIDKAMVEAMIRQVMKGDVKAFEALTNRHEGKPHQTMDLEVSEPPVPIMPVKRKKP